ncbi:hypothetical protein [Pyrobaculum aerophilum]|uniref:Uncharacterized protein n=1 Tax=Pyrobaculum aerophilum TaxID=13773 RepID=A0A832WH52_9CREN|nr:MULTISPECIES: hypothetical protein [Pyrobaculum]MCX8135827.1 hypothetical protein [Pyrobaculum aerophilum]HII47155.1 hypothetical protein [Pyrobaculum aerophilum]
MDIIIEEVRRAFGNTDEGKVAERLILAYKEGGARAARAVIREYLQRLGVDVADRED